MREELKIGEATSTPMREAWVTGTATALGAFIPVAPLLFEHRARGRSGPRSRSRCCPTSRVGAARSFFTGRGVFRSGHGHVPRGPGRGGGGLPAGRLDREAAVNPLGGSAVSSSTRRSSSAPPPIATSPRCRRAARRTTWPRSPRTTPPRSPPRSRHCRALGIGAFRINSQILPLGTHPVSGYTLDRARPRRRHPAPRSSGRRAGPRAATSG